MPANLTPQYLSAESDYRKAQTPKGQLEALKCMLREIPKHKGTDRMQADIKTKIAKLRVVVEQQELSGKSSTQTMLPAQGVGRIVMIGPPSSGKSHLLKSMTRAKVNPGSNPFTTRTAQVGMIQWEECQLQLVDLPSLGHPAAEIELTQWMRSADLVWIVFDISSDLFIEQTQEIIVRFDTEKTRFGINTVLVAGEVGVKNVATLLVANQIDRLTSDLELSKRLESLNEFNEKNLQILPVSAASRLRLEMLAMHSASAMNIIRIYCKRPKDSLPDLEKPLFLRRGDTVKNVAAQIHQDLLSRVTGAKVWKSADSSFEIVNSDYFLCDKDIIELILA